MNVAELFVNLGITGADKTVGALGDVKKGLGGVASMSLEAKAAILAALYGFERMMAQSGQAGTGLMNFAALTGLSAKNLQQWQYAARQAGVASEDLTGSLKGVQNSMTNMLLGKGAPEGFALVKNAVGLDTNRLRDTFYVMQQLQKAAQALPKDVGNNVLKSFGLSEDTIAAMRRNAFNPTNLNKAPTYSNNEIGALDKANVAWSNLGNKVQMAFGHFNAKHGQDLVKDISKVTDSVVKLVEAFIKLSDKLKLFQKLGSVFEGWTAIFQGITATINNPKEALKTAGQIVEGVGLEIGDAISPSKPAGAQSNNSTTNIHQNITHHGDVKDTKKVGAAHKTAANAAYRQRPNYVGN